MVPKHLKFWYIGYFKYSFSDHQAIVLSAKFSKIFLGILSKFSFSENSSESFQKVFLSKFLGKNPRNFVQLAAPKFSDFCVRKLTLLTNCQIMSSEFEFSNFPWKIWQIFWQILVQLAEQNSQVFYRVFWYEHFSLIWDFSPNPEKIFENFIV